jgi:hypothetical protein
MAYDPTKPNANSAANLLGDYVREAVNVARSRAGTDKTLLTNADVQIGSLFYDTILSKLYYCSAIGAPLTWVEIVPTAISGQVWAYAQGRATNGACTILANNGITSITRTALGIYDVVMSSAKEDTNYAVLAMATHDGAALIAQEYRFGGGTRSVTNFTLDFFAAYDAAWHDPDYINIFVYR